MYCRNCGLKISDEAAICPHCGVPVGKGNKYCPGCGATTLPTDRVCVMCGTVLSQPGKDWLITLLLNIFLGTLGAHRFYTGNYGIAVAQLFTLGGCGIWTLIDLILILAGTYRDGEGNLLDRSKY